MSVFTDSGLIVIGTVRRLRDRMSLLSRPVVRPSLAELVTLSALTKLPQLPLPLSNLPNLPDLLFRPAGCREVSVGGGLFPLD